MHMDINSERYEVTAEGLTVELLPKEFALFQFLHRNAGRTFSREQLLDKVWPLEYPVERTVDDHIYRLRKKLKPLHGLEIRTIRGLGYSLVLPIPHPSEGAIPTLADPELHETMRALLGKYQLYGQGRSMLTLARQQDVLGYKLDPDYSVYIHFVQGDLDSLLNKNEVHLRDRLYYLLLFFCLSGSPERALPVCDRMLALELLSPPHHREMEILTILDIYTLAGEPMKALERLRFSYRVIAELNYDSFIPQTAISELLAHLVAGSPERKIEKLAHAIEDGMLTEMPFLREIGSYKVVKGLWLQRRGDGTEAEKLLDEGLSVLERSGFVPLRLLSLYRIVHYFIMFPPPLALHRKYKELFDMELDRIGASRLSDALETVIRGELG
ncbi:MAG: winged helix-turn-helix domain-containing protein [Paenibacillaceae bacterium]|uniref:winged helix-turn-helix domain-containing protein n=1 Tax=Paenibacillus mellifer TaxID=2937794 RepID=UPI0024A67AEF|nr:winged helix-turn-helix domain-containing protein [Paenibacillus mellifer]MBW4839909.1 winged helix-turn-helix domain-containing protein [Paenibacillaceae bacterium]